METTHGNQQKKIVCIYEMAGTAFLVYAVNISGGNPIAIAFALFTVILIGGPISGGHFNPAVTTGYFISQNKKDYEGNAILFVMMLASQFIGGLIGICVAFASLTNVTVTENYKKGSIPESE